MSSPAATPPAASPDAEDAEAEPGAPEPDELAEAEADSLWHGVPFTLHAHQMESGGSDDPREQRNYSGSPRWSNDFARYISGALPAAVVEERHRWRNWWLDEYVVSRLRARVGERRLAVVLAVKRDGANYYIAARDHRVSVRFIDQQVRQLTRIVRQEYLPYATPRRARPPIQSARADRQRERQTERAAS